MWSLPWRGSEFSDRKSSNLTITTAWFGVIQEGGGTNSPWDSCEGFREDELGLQEMGEGQRGKGTWAEEGEFMACWGEDWGGKLVKDLLRHHAKHLELGA